jgi:hypothetical protein
MLAGAAKLHLEPQSAVIRTGDLVATVPETGDVVWRQLTSIVLGPRPPPIAMA